jgi:hypothetical protein
MKRRLISSYGVYILCVCVCVCVCGGYSRCTFPFVQRTTRTNGFGVVYLELGGTYRSYVLRYFVSPIGDCSDYFCGTYTTYRICPSVCRSVAKIYRIPGSKEAQVFGTSLRNLVCHNTDCGTLLPIF